MRIWRVAASATAPDQVRADSARAPRTTAPRVGASASDRTSSTAGAAPAAVSSSLHGAHQPMVGDGAVVGRAQDGGAARCFANLLLHVSSCPGAYRPIRTELGSVCCHRRPTSNESFNLLQLIANDCYRMGQFLYAAKAFDVLERLDPDPEFWEGKRGACVGVFQQVVAGKAAKEDLRDVLAMVRNTSNPQVEYMVRVISKWAASSGIKIS